MSCTTKDFESRKVSEALELLYNEKSPAYKLSPKGTKDTLVITPTSKSKIKNLDQAYRAAQTMVEKLNKKFGQEHRFDKYGNWATIKRSTFDVKVEIKIPNKYLADLKRKEDFQRDIDYFNEDTALYEQEQKESRDFFDAPKELNEEVDQVNFPAFLDFKRKMLERATQSRMNLEALRPHNKNNRELSYKISKLKNIETKLNQDIAVLTDPDTIFEQIMSFMNSDIDTIEELLDNNNIDNLHTAQKMISYYQSIADLDYGSNNPMLNTREIYDKEGNPTLAPEILGVFENLNSVLHGKDGKRGLVGRLRENQEAYLKDLIDNSDHLQRLYPGLEIEEILKDREDISAGSQFFLTIDKQFLRQDSLLAQLMKIEIEESRSNNKAFVGDIIRRMESLMPALKNKLPKIAKIPYWFGKSFIENDWSMFYQQKENGGKTGRMVDKLSSSWFSTFNKAMKSINDNYYDGIRNRDGNKINAALKKKFEWLNQNTDFINVGKLPEVLENSEYVELYDLSEEGSQEYKQELIDRVGEDYYNKIVEAQLQQLEDFQEYQEQIIESKLLEYNVSNFEDLPPKIQRDVRITFLRNNPFEVVKSQQNNQEGRVDLIDGNNSAQFQSELKYVEYLPKEKVNVYDKKSGKVIETDSNYYDENYKKIEKDKDLLAFHKILEEATTFMNMTLADSENMLKHGSIPSMEKSFWDILIDPQSGVGNKFVSISRNLVDSIKSLISSKSGNKNADDFNKINKQQFKSNEQEVYKRSRVINFELSRQLGGDHNLDKKVDLNKVSQKYINTIAKEFGLSKDRTKFIEQIGKGNIVNTKSLIKDMYTDQVINEQTLNLPVLLRAYLEMTAEYKAQKESQPQLSIYKQFYESIKRESTNKNSNDTEKAMDLESDKNNLGRQRVRANKRMNHWYNRNILNSRDQAEWVNFSRFFGKVKDSYEKKLLKELKEQYKGAHSQEQRDELKKQMDNIGANITLAAIYDSVINKFTVWKGLAYSVKSNLVNRFQGIFQGLVYDTGIFWKAGNAEISTSFIMKKGLRYLPGQGDYKEEIKKVRLLINNLNILQDATNEMDRARNESGLTGVAKKIQPFYLTEYTEWHNQTSHILAMLMDKPIIDKDGNSVPIFDGKSLPAFEIKDGRLQLRPEFRYDNEGNEMSVNIDTWENLSNKEAAANKMFMIEVINIINGDYSKTGTTYIKKTPIGRSLMLFKTWMPNNIWRRISVEQPNLILGKKGLKSVYSSHRASTLGTTLGAVGLTVAGPVGAGLGLGIGAGIGHMISRTQGTVPEQAKIRDGIKIAQMGMALAKKMIGLPVNLVSGRQLVKHHDVSNLAKDQQDAQNLSSILNELSVILSFVLFKIMIKGLMGVDDEEEELKTMKNSAGQTVTNPYYYMEKVTETDRMMHNVFENEITRLLDDMTMYQNPKALYESTIARNAVFQLFQDGSKLLKAMSTYGTPEGTVLQGPDRGNSKLFSSAKKTFLPGIFQNPTTLGFGKSMEDEYDKSEYFDTFFQSDYKKDRKQRSMENSMTKQEIYEVELEKRLKEYKEERGMDPSFKHRRRIEDTSMKAARKKAARQEPAVERRKYDENQMLKDEFKDK